jgi:type IV pilus assembly protein PilC
MKEKKLDNQTIATFTRQLGLVLDSDLPLHSGLEVIQAKSKNLQVIQMIDEVLVQLKEGYGFSESLQKYDVLLTPFVTNMIALGEKSGSLLEVLNQISDTLEKEIEMKSKVRSALTYPIVLSVLMLGVIVLLIVKVFPTFTDILNSLGGEMPLFTDIMMSVSSFLSSNILIIIGVIVLIGFAYSFYKNSEKGTYALDKLKFSAPIQKDIAAAVIGTKFSRNLAILIKSGFSFSISMEMLKPIMNNTYMEMLLDDASKKLKDGTPMSEVIESFNIFPGVMIRLFSVAEQTGHMDRMLEKIADEMEKEADAKLNNVSTVIEPLLIIILSLLIGIILVSVILPVINILNSIG